VFFKSRRQVPEHAHAISSPSCFIYGYLFFFSKFGIYLTAENILNIVFKMSCCDCALLIHVKVVRCVLTTYIELNDALITTVSVNFRKTFFFDTRTVTIYNIINIYKFVFS